MVTAQGFLLDSLAPITWADYMPETVQNVIMWHLPYHDFRHQCGSTHMLPRAAAIIVDKGKQPLPLGAPVAGSIREAADGSVEL